MRIHDRVLYYAEKLKLGDVIEVVFVESEGIKLSLRYNMERSGKLVVEANGKTIAESDIEPKPELQTFLLPYKEKPDYIDLKYTMLVEPETGVVRRLSVGFGEVWFLVAWGDVNKYVRIIDLEKGKHYVFNPVDIDGDGQGMLGVLIEGDNISKKENFSVEHNGLAVKLYKLDPSIAKQRIQVSIKVYEQ